MVVKVLIVDDDKIELNQFKNSIRWETLGFEVIGVALNGAAGFKRYQELMPDLVITDIEMPGISGIELAEMIRKNDETTKIVFLSSHEKFEYAHSGYKLDISDYMLKQDLDMDKTNRKLLKLKQDIIEVNSRTLEKTEKVLLKILKNEVIGEPDSKEYLSIIRKNYCVLAVFGESLLPFFNQFLNKPILKNTMEFNDIKNLLLHKYHDFFFFH